LAHRDHAAKSCIVRRFTTPGKDISQSFVSAADFPQGEARFDRIMLDPKG
jgi:hypothetical protein